MKILDQSPCYHYYCYYYYYVSLLLLVIIIITIIIILLLSLSLLSFLLLLLSLLLLSFEEELYKWNMLCYVVLWPTLQNGPGSPSTAILVPITDSCFMSWGKSMWTALDLMFSFRRLLGGLYGLKIAVRGRIMLIPASTETASKLRGGVRKKYWTIFEMKIILSRWKLW